MPDVLPTDAPVRAPEQPAVTATAKITAVVEAHDARLAARAQLHPVAQALDQIGDIVGICVVGAMCVAGRLSGESAAVIVLLILGIQTGLRSGLARLGAPRAGAAALLLLGLGQVLAAGTQSHAGFVRVPRFLEHIVVGIRLAWAWATSEPPAPKRSRRGYVRGRALVLAVGLALAAAPLVACSGQRAQVATIVAMGGSLNAIHEAHRGAYTRATDTLRAEVRAEHGTLADYDRRVMPLDAAFTARSSALQALSASLYAAAAIVDAVDRGAAPSEYMPAAVDTIHALQRVLDVLGDGAVLPRVPIPPEVRTALVALEGIARAGGALLPSPDAGADGGDR